MGSTSSIGAGDSDFYAVKVDSSGELEWEAAYGTELTETCQEVIQTPDDGYALVGYTGVTIGQSGPLDSWVVRIDGNGDVLWEKTYDWMDYGYLDRFYSIIQTDDDGFVCAGYASTMHAKDYYLVRMNEDGDVLWLMTFGNNGSDACYSVISTSDGGYALAGEGYGQGEGLYEYWLVKTTPDPVSVPRLLDPAYPSDIVLNAAYPNPFNSTTLVSCQVPEQTSMSIQIFDLKGRLVTTLLNDVVQPGSYELTWDAAQAPSGLYICRMKTEGFSQMVKLSLIR